MAKKNAAIKDAADDNDPGACYITDKQSGEQRCHLLTETECTAQGGVFYGGPCGPFAEALKSYTVSFFLDGRKLLIKRPKIALQKISDRSNGSSPKIFLFGSSVQFGP